ncbi:MAG TPA: hypothetical protein VK348_11935 [Planctomycetota bacterium]|nr:hypothetical protein [Planctomycetota bacterium]
MSFTPRFRITHAIATALTAIERARGFLEAAQLSADWIQRMGERALILEAHHTTHIEGTRLTLAQAERLWAGEQVPEADPLRSAVQRSQPSDAATGPEGPRGEGFAAVQGLDEPITVLCRQGDRVKLATDWRHVLRHA